MEKQLIANAKSNIYPFHMPGHKRRSLGELNPYDIDITEIEGYDNLHDAKGIIKEAQDMAAQLYGADESYFLINGSTCGILAAISAATKPGDTIIVARNCHKAVYHAIYLRQLIPVYVHPEVCKIGIQGMITPEEIGKALESNPEAKAIVITSPTYDGVVSDVRKIAELAHERKIPLIVDEAHGAHFGFHEAYPENATKLGADAIILSLHKTLPAFTQTALLNICGNYISKAKVEMFLGIYETSSPSYIFMTGIERCLKYVEKQGQEDLRKLSENLREFYRDCEKLKYLKVLRKTDFNKDSNKMEVYDFDESKIIILTEKSGMSGQQLIDELLEKYEIQLEMAAGNYALALCSLMDTNEGFKRFSRALIEIDIQCESISKNEDGKIPDVSIYQNLLAVKQIHEALESETEAVPLESASGKVSGAFVNLYPPGIPLLVPGEQINDKLVDDIKRAKSLNMDVCGLTENNMIIILKGQQ